MGALVANSYSAVLHPAFLPTLPATRPLSLKGPCHVLRISADHAAPAGHHPHADPQRRVDGWSPARQRRFLEILAATGVIMLACEGVRITARSAYTLRIRHDGAAFRLGWDAAILIARARLADDLLSRAIMGSEEVIRKDPDNYEVRRAPA